MKNNIDEKPISPYVSDICSDILYLDGEEASTVMRMIKEKYVCAHHSRELSYLEKKDVWRTYIGTPRREVTRRKKEDLIEYLYQFYKGREMSSSTVEEVFVRMEEYRLKIQNRSENTIERDRQVLERFFDKKFLQKRIIELTDLEIAAYINKRSKELRLKERALQDSCLLLNKIFDYAMKHDKILKHNPVTCVDLEDYYKNCDISEKGSDEEIFSEQQIDAIKEQIRKDMSRKIYDVYGFAMLFSIETGVRVAEIPPLRWEDITEIGIHIHRQQRMTRIKGKGRTFDELPYTKDERRHPHGGRFFPETAKIKEILDELRACQEKLGIQSEYIFCDENGNWINKETYSQRLRRMCRRMGFKVTNNHAFRKSFNSNVLIPLGIPVTERAYLLGHSVEVNERYYSHSHTESLSGIKEVLEQSFTQRSRRKIVDFKNKKIS